MIRIAGDRRRVRVAAVLAALALVATACSGVPSSSKPQVIGPRLGEDPLGSQPSNTPPPNAEPREIVQHFLQANVDEPLDPRGPHEFLTPDEQRKWLDNSVTVLAGGIDSAKVGLGQTGTTHAVSVTVEGTQIASVDANGVYTAWPVATGGKGTQWSQAYGLDPINSQFRISDAPDGLVVYAQDFLTKYRPVPLYFLDLNETRLVPDVRYTRLETAQAVATWALNELVYDGPQPDLTNAVRSEIPKPAGRPSVSVNGLQVRVELPGSARLDSDSKIRMAAQLMATLASQLPKMTLTITDGGVPVDIGNMPQAFKRSDFARLPSPTVPGQQVHFFDQTPDPPAQWPLFYIDAKHRLVTGDGQPVAGPLGTPNRYDLNSVAITGARADPNYYVAACLGSGSQQTLWMGRTTGGLTAQAKVPRGPLTRPSWLAGQLQVWVASGSTVYAVQYSDQSPTQTRTQTVPVSLQAGARIKALRLSPEGSRVAMIIDQAGASQLWIGSIVRTDNAQGGTSARIDSIEPVTPPSYRLTDVAWGDDSGLWIVGSGPDGESAWTVNPDGAMLNDPHLAGLPQPQRIDSITAGVGVVPWVSASKYVYVDSADSQGWEGPGRHTTGGTNPAYQEGYLD